MKTHKLSELVLDFDLYPRGEINSYHVTEIASAIEAGATIPQIVIEKKSKRIVDGFHRWKALNRLHKKDYETECVEKIYKNDQELLLDAMRYNRDHGQPLTQHDKTRCLILASKLGIPETQVCKALYITPSRIKTMQQTRMSFGRFGSSKTNQKIPLKASIRHKAGQRLTKKQIEANEKLSGWDPSFHITQLLLLLGNDLIDGTDSQLLNQLSELSGKIDTFLTPFRKAS